MHAGWPRRVERDSYRRAAARFSSVNTRALSGVHRIVYSSLRRPHRVSWFSEAVAVSRARPAALYSCATRGCSTCSHRTPSRYSCRIPGATPRRVMSAPVN
ncbi:hypothetical protein ALC62_06016 [Cyphomyrmex costatus]|uniref:Uncharacterized protein n=1 Tax=Cyphomyrmex costatus TaxID=456900 RepID=A0A195CSQ9_9HYME|nr:hypothetical protein ALC62_06016 [Cyphomyrmex costatus]